MANFARRLFTFCAAVSLLLCIATVVLWIRGTRTVDRVSLATVLGRYIELASDGGGLAITVADGWHRPEAERWTSGEYATAATFVTGGKVVYDVGVVSATANMRYAAENFMGGSARVVDEYRKNARVRHERAVSDLRASVEASRVGPVAGSGSSPASLQWETRGWGVHAGRGPAVLLTVDPASAGDGRRGNRDWVPVDLRFLRVRYGVLVLLTAALPALWLTPRLAARRRAWDRRRRSLCVACGYDLRASPERCPECGAVATTTTTTTTGSAVTAEPP